MRRGPVSKGVMCSSNKKAEMRLVVEQSLKT